MKKVLIPTAVFASLAIASASAFAAVNTSVPASQPAQAAVVSAAAVNSNSVGTVEYAKKTLYQPDGSVAAVDESWADTATHNQRSDYREAVQGKDGLQRVGGAYVLNNGSKYIKVGASGDGSLIGYELIAKTADQDWSNLLVADKQDYVDEYKEGTRGVRWTEAGNVKTAEGQSLRKLTRTDKSEVFDTAYTETVLLNDSGLPVQGEIYEIVNGKTNLLYTYEYEFKNVANDGTLFDTSAIQLKAIQ